MSPMCWERPYLQVITAQKLVYGLVRRYPVSVLGDVRNSPDVTYQKGV